MIRRTLTLLAMTVAGAFIGDTSSKASTLPISFPFASVTTTYCDAPSGGIFNPFAFNCPQQVPGSSAVRNFEAHDSEGNAITLHVSAANNPFGPVALVEGRTSNGSDSGGFAVSAGAEVDYQVLVSPTLVLSGPGGTIISRIPVTFGASVTAQAAILGSGQGAANAVAVATAPFGNIQDCVSSIPNPQCIV